MREEVMMSVKSKRLIRSGDLITPLLMCVALSGALSACIQDPPSLSRDPSELGDVDQGGNEEGGESVGAGAEIISEPDTDVTPDLSVDVDMSVITEPDVEVAGALAGVEAGVEAGAEAGELAGAFAGVEAGELAGEVTEWPELELPLPEVSDEVCDGVDNDLDALVDEGLNNPCGGCAPLDPETGCVSWRSNLTQTQGLSDDGAPTLGELDPGRLISLGSSILVYEEFEVEGGRCERYGTPQAWQGTSTLGNAALTTPRASLSLIPSPLQPGRYQALGEDEPFTVHAPQDAVRLRWDGSDDPTSPTDITLDPGELNLTSPEQVELATDRELDRVIEALQSPEAETPTTDPVTLRWVAAPEVDDNGAEVAGPPMTLYVGGSQSLSQRGAYREIRHYLFVAKLFDDGRFDWSMPSELRAPGSSIWVYLERAVSAGSYSGAHPVSMRVGHRAERRASAAGGVTNTPTALVLSAPSADQPEPDVATAGLEVRWSLADPSKAPEQVSASLILYDTTWTEQITCVADDPSGGALLIPPDRLAFWPRGPQSVRQLTLRADTARVGLDFPDRGVFRRSDSLILRLSDLAP